MEKRLRYPDLVERGIVSNRTTLKNWIDKRDFPGGQLTGPNCRTWAEGEVQTWLDSRPTAQKLTPRSKGRPRRTAAHALMSE